MLDGQSMTATSLSINVTKPIKEFDAVSPVPHFDRVSRGGEDGQVVGAEGQRADISAVAAKGEASRLIGCGGLV